MQEDPLHVHRPVVPSMPPMPPMPRMPTDVLPSPLKRMPIVPVRPVHPVPLDRPRPARRPPRQHGPVPGIVRLLEHVGAHLARVAVQLVLGLCLVVLVLGVGRGRGRRRAAAAVRRDPDGRARSGGGRGAVGGTRSCWCLRREKRRALARSRAGRACGAARRLCVRLDVGMAVRVRLVRPSSSTVGMPVPVSAAAAAVRVPAMVMEQEEADNVAHEAGAPDDGDELRVGHLCLGARGRGAGRQLLLRMRMRRRRRERAQRTGVVDEARDGLHADREAQREEEDAVDECCE